MYYLAVQPLHLSMSLSPASEVTTAASKAGNCPLFPKPFERIVRIEATPLSCGLTKLFGCETSLI